MRRCNRPDARPADDVSGPCRVEVREGGEDGQSQHRRGGVRQELRASSPARAIPCQHSASTVGRASAATPCSTPNRHLRPARVLGMPCSTRWMKQYARGSWRSTDRACVFRIRCSPRFVTSRHRQQSDARCIGPSRGSLSTRRSAPVILRPPRTRRMPMSPTTWIAPPSRRRRVARPRPLRSCASSRLNYLLQAQQHRVDGGFVPRIFNASRATANAATRSWMSC
jgi:hypothetical protein